MKTFSTLIKKIGIACILICCTTLLNAQVTTDGMLVFSAVLDGDQEVPAVTTNAQGLAGFKLSPFLDTLWVEATVTGLSSGITGAHIHIGAPGSTGSVAIGLNDLRTDSSYSGYVTGSVLTNSIIEQMILGNTYFNVHTSNHTSGEIRGQIMLETDHLFYTVLSGDNEVPAVTSAAKGLAIVGFSQDWSTMATFVLMTDIVDFTASHFHYGAAGVNGPPFLHLTNFVDGNMIMMDTMFASATVSAAILDSILAGKVYLNIHTAANTGGEIRGQLMPAPGLPLITLLNGDNEVPPVSTSANGMAVAWISADLTTLNYHVLFDSLTSPVSGAHFHNGGEGENGGVILGITDSVSGNVIVGSASGPTIDDSFIRNLLIENIYLNVHTDSNTSGEIRGQMMPMYRPGDIFQLCGGQEVPAVTTDATGTGVVSVGRVAHNLHYMVAYDGIEDFTASHFHEAGAGINGGVVFNITSSFDGNVAEGYWADTGSDAFQVNVFEAGNLYVNVHSTTHGSGEIRGQLRDNVSCSPVGILAHENGIDFSIYPVPVTDVLNVKLNAELSGNALLTLSDIQGREVLAFAEKLNPGASNLNIDMSSYKAGIYILSVRAGGSVSTIKVIKK